VLGLLTQFRPVSLAAVPVVMLWLAAARGAAPGRRALHALALAGGCALVLAPSAHLSQRIRGELSPVALVGVGTAPVSTEDAALPAVAGSILNELRYDPLSVARHVARELGHFWEPFPTRLATDDPARVQQLRAREPRLPTGGMAPPSLRSLVSGVTFGIELALALVGLAVAWRARPRETVLLVGIIASYALGYAFFAARLRYRIPVLPLLLVFSAVGAVAAFRALSAWRAGHRGATPPATG
jgi:hypothetical protein